MMTADQAETFLRRLDAMDRALVAAGFPATSPWWTKEIRRFFRSRVRRWVVRAGRRAGKSSTVARLAVAWALWGAWSVPPGDCGVIAIVSVNRDEALGRLRTIKEILRTLKIRFTERGDEIELHDRRCVFRVTTCSVDAVGFTAILLIGDEVSRWESRESSANPAREVLGSLRPTMATIPTAFEVLVSSPWGVDDAHAEAFDAGDTAHQIASYAPTWIANPTISERRTHELEPDPKTWSREYAAVPGATLSAALDRADLAASFGRNPTGRLGRGFLAIDASSLRGDGFTFIAGRETDAGELAVLEVGGWEGDDLRRVSMAEIVRTIAERAKAWSTSTIFGDQREEAALGALFAEHRIQLHVIPWTETSKDEAVMLLRRMMRERTLSLCEHAGLRRELEGMKARLLPSGRIKYETNGLDYASALITLCHAAAANEVLAGADWTAARAINAHLTSTESSRWASFKGFGFG
jgi:hypothetical protein